MPTLLLSGLSWAQTSRVQGTGEETIPLNQQTVPAPVVPPEVGSADTSGQIPSVRQITYSATIALADGAELFAAPMVVQYRPSCKIEVFRSGTVVVHVPLLAPQEATDPHPAIPKYCPATFLLPGYRSAYGVSEGQMIVLQRLGPDEGSTVSMTVLRAPKKAKRAYSRGELELSRKHWEKAISQFKKAAVIYPEYSAAWSEEGRAFQASGKLDEAEYCYRQASRVDPSYLKPYFQLAAIEAEQKHWNAVRAATDPALKLNPVEFPGIYFYDALASLNLGDLLRAEHSVRKSIQVDTHNEFPQARMVLGTVLLEKEDTSGAVAAYRDFVTLAPEAPEAEVVRRWIARLDKSH